MDADFWLTRWHRGETGWHLEEVNRHLSTFWPPLAVPAGTQVLVPLCGKTIDLLWLAGQGYRVLGVELSPLAVDAFFAHNGLTPTVTDDAGLRRHRVDELEILCGDVFALPPAQLAGVGAVYDRAALIALPPELRERYAAHLAALLPAGVPRLLITLEYDQALMAGPPFSVSSAEVQQLFGETHRITALGTFDALPESPGMRQRGLTELTERVYRLDPA
ncbi:thiopurine S-methyltransferase [uncultured Thiodictyon sp.]|uniref:thiopurine S-methyltransferase n=1 Tax=uncultured Thiodictyon sp. TaxID=1846217 RepID=UPI0025E1C9A1|nr:thiopurine S-methyltransferase [uncultured Thiodictyon sp.]